VPTPETLRVETVAEAAGDELDVDDAAVELEALWLLEPQPEAMSTIAGASRSSFRTLNTLPPRP
jgi:hypothetical protein